MGESGRGSTAEPATTHIKSVFKVEVVMSVEMAADEFVDLRLGSGVEVLEFMHSLEFYDVQTVWKHSVGLAFEQVFRFISGDVRDGCEYIRTMG